MLKIYRFFFLLFPFLFPSLLADERHSEVVDEELVVISSRIPTVASEVIGSVDSITSEDLDLNMIDSLAELVRFVPGVSAHKENQYGRSFTDDLHIRGIHGGAIYLIDGQRISDSYTGYGRDIVDTDLLKTKVEVMRKLGVPYEEGVEDDLSAVEGKTEMEALIAYLQMLGTNVKK